MSVSLYPNTKMIIEYIAKQQGIPLSDAAELFYCSDLLRQMQANPKYYKTWSPFDLYQEFLKQESRVTL